MDMVQEYNKKLNSLVTLQVRLCAYTESTIMACLNRQRK